ncbi:MAG: NAD-dependent epimerase/dehydratase family protein, partial [Methylotenera sp.]|nr:NAD-dependent epimerase/dehydratase family protein [Methylotenera sp.]
MINQKILVTGASGFVGKSLCAELLSQGYSVLAAVRSSSSVVKNAEMVTIGEIDGDADWTDALKGVDV